MEVGVREEGGNRGSGVGGREDREPVSWRNFMDTEGSVWVVRKTRGIFMTTCNGVGGAGVPFELSSHANMYFYFIFCVI